MIREVQSSDTPNSGRLIWNANDRALEASLRRIEGLLGAVPQARDVTAPGYGAAGDGVADDRPALQAAINETFAAGGGYVFLPAGTYLLKSGSLVLRDNVHLLGAGTYATTIKLGSGVNLPVITDEVAGVPGRYAFGRVYLGHFAVDGNKANNPRGQEGIFTSAFYSRFEDLYVHSCKTHGIRMGFPGQANESSQNRVTGCRVQDCDDTGVLLDINGVDHTIAENYIHRCNFGVVVRNGGVRLVNNGIFAHREAAVLVTQTSYSTIIANNDINANRQHAIRVTRTSLADGRNWSQILLTGNVILGDYLEQHNAFDGINVQTAVPEGINELTIVGNKIYTINGSHANQFRFGVNLESNVVGAKCVANHVVAASADYNVGRSCARISLDSNGPGPLAAPPLPSSGTPLTNPFHVPATVYIGGGQVSAVAIGGRATGLTQGCFRVPAGQTITLTYRDPPSWTWHGE